MDPDAPGCKDTPQERGGQQPTVSRTEARTQSVHWVLRLTWSAAPGLLTGIVGVTLIRSVIPAALAWVAKSLIDSLMIEIDASAPSVAAIMPWLSFGLVLAVLDALAGSVRPYLSRRLADDLNLKVTTDILTHAAGLDIEFFEDIGEQDTLQRARRTTGSRFSTLITQTFGTISSGLQVVSLAAVLIVIQPWTLLVVALVAPPFLLVRWMLARREYALEYNTHPGLRLERRGPADGQRRAAPTEGRTSVRVQEPQVSALHPGRRFDGGLRRRYGRHQLRLGLSLVRRDLVRAKAPDQNGKRVLKAGGRRDSARSPRVPEVDPGRDH